MEQDAENQIHSVCSCVTKGNWGVKNPLAYFHSCIKAEHKGAHTPLLPHSHSSPRRPPQTTLAPGPVAFARRTSTPATAAGTKDGAPGRAAAVAPVGGVPVAPAPAAAEDAAPRGDAGGAAAGGRTGAEVRDGSLSGTVGRERNVST